LAAAQAVGDHNAADVTQVLVSLRVKQVAKHTIIEEANGRSNKG
jgi:hypothetical protein